VRLGEVTNATRVLTNELVADQRRFVEHMGRFEAFLRRIDDVRQRLVPRAKQAY
jgi:hypothetical protein